MQPSPTQPLGARKGAKGRVTPSFELSIAKTRNEGNRALPDRFEAIQRPIQPALVDLGRGGYAFRPFDRKIQGTPLHHYSV